MHIVECLVMKGYFLGHTELLGAVYGEKLVVLCVCISHFCIYIYVHCLSARLVEACIICSGSKMKELCISVGLHMIL